MYNTIKGTDGSIIEWGVWLPDRELILSIHDQYETASTTLNEKEIRELIAVLNGVLVTVNPEGDSYSRRASTFEDGGESMLTKEQFKLWTGRSNPNLPIL